MDREERFAQSLETGQDEGLSRYERARLDELRDALGSDFVWEEPPLDLGDRIMAEIGGPDVRPAGRWLWAVAAAVILVAGTVGVINLLEDPPPTPVAVIAMAGTDLAPEATGSANLHPTPNGWAISFESVGLPPAEAGTFYQAWVNNGEDAVAVGTFHMRGDDVTPIPLWSGVDLHEYRILNVTIQEEGQGPESSGRLVMTGTADRFDDE
jgi:hypothetical protein